MVQSPERGAWAHGHLAHELDWVGAQDFAGHVKGALVSFFELGQFLGKAVLVCRLAVLNVAHGAGDVLE